MSGHIHFPLGGADLDNTNFIQFLLMECTKKMTHLALSQDAKMAILTCPFEPPKLGPLAPTQGQQLCNA
jgi:hypothetical protein